MPVILDLRDEAIKHIEELEIHRPLLLHAPQILRRPVELVCVVSECCVERSLEFEDIPQ